MLKIVAVILALIAVLAAGVIAYAATKPDTFRVARSIEIAAPPEKIFALVSDLRGWSAWSPYEKKDPDMRRAFAGAASGKGAVYSWDGDKNVGTGRMEIIEAAAPNKVAIQLDFQRPFEAHNVAEFTMMPANADASSPTQVTWAMHGPNLLIGKVIGVFVDMDKMIGRDFEEGLANLKTVAER